MNNFVFSQDPLLFQSYQSKIPTTEDFETRQKQLNDMMFQYKQMAQPRTERDYLGELDTLIRSLRKEVSDNLMSDVDYTRLNGELQSLIQEEIMSGIKWRINSNSNAVKNIEKQIELINREKNKTEEEERKNINEINDYMRNYSSITFDEYKKLKNSDK